MGKIENIHKKLDKAEALITKARIEIAEIQADDIKEHANLDLLLTDGDYRIYIALLKFNGKRAKTAQYLGISERTLYRKLLDSKYPVNDIKKD